MYKTLLFLLLTIILGIIFTGLEQKYTSNKREWKYPMYKYKPPSHNSIDFYVLFERNRYI